jgi:hypothetical protein
MGQLLHALHERKPLPAWAPQPYPPLPRGPYPTSRWPEGLTHLAQPAGGAK